MEEYKKFETKKTKTIVLTNRFDSEKRPNETLALFADLKKKYPDWKFVVCTGRSVFRSNVESIVEFARTLEAQGIIEIRYNQTKDQYHQLLSEASIMVSHSIEEHFGYAIVEALIYKCAPFLRHGLSHIELINNDSRLLFKVGEEEAKIEALMNTVNEGKTLDFPYEDLYMRYTESLTQICNILKGLYD